jgi:HlyD family secretion protein
MLTWMRRRRRGIATVVSIGLAGVLAAAWLEARVADRALYNGPTRPVDRGPLVISVSEAGTIEAREKVVLKCEVNERTTAITYIVPEGTHVKKGELVVQLDSSVLQDELYDEQIDVTNTEAEFLVARENLEVVKNQVKSDTSLAELTLRFAKEDLKQYVEGEYPKLLMEARNQVTLAEEKMEQARDTLQWSEKLSPRRRSTSCTTTRTSGAWTRCRRRPAAR